MLATLQAISFAGEVGSQTASEAATNLLFSSISSQDLKGVQIAIKQGADLNATLHGTSPISAVLSNLVLLDDHHQKEKSRAILNYLFAKGSRLSGHRDELFCAVISKDKSLMALLLEQGLDPHSKAYGYSSVELAYLYKADNLISLLKSRNVTDIAPEIRQVMKIMRALVGNDSNELQKLIHDQDALNQYAPNGRTPLLEALHSSSWIMVPDCCLLLFSGSPNFNLPSRNEEDYGKYPIHFLTETMTREPKFADSVALLISALIRGNHMDPNVKDNLQRTPLHDAAKLAYPQVAKALLLGGANPLATDYRGQRPSSLAKTPEIRSLLLEAELTAKK